MPRGTVLNDSRSPSTRVIWVTKKNRGHPRVSDDERLEMFMESFHVLTQKPYWPELRELGNVSNYGRVRLRQLPGSAQLYMQQSQMDPMRADLAGAYMRKYITGADEISIDKVLAAAERSFGLVDGLAEAKLQWEQVASKPFNFLVEDGQVVRHVIDLPEGLTRVEEPPGENLEPVSLTIRDFSEVFFYDGFLHAQDYRKDSGNRPLVRSIPGILQTIMSHAAISASLYASLILHHLISEASPSWCPSDCRETPILRGHMASARDDPDNDGSLGNS